MKNNETQQVKANFNFLRERWKWNLLGVDEINKEDLDIKLIIEKTTKNAVTVWNSLNKSEHRKYLWETLYNDKVSGNITECYIRLKEMAIAYCMKGSELEGNKALLDDIINALEWLYENRYNENTDYYDNWWPFDIGVPLSLNDIVVLLYDDLTENQILKYMKAIEKFAFDPTVCRADKVKTTGANRVDMCKVVAVSGIILKSESMMMRAKENLREVFQYVSEGDGFYTDGSFVQHGAIPYTCSYGAVLIEGLSVMQLLLSNSPWQLDYAEANNIYDWIYNSYEPLIYKGAAMDMARGRAVSRYFLQDHVIGHDIISSILRISNYAPDPHNTKLKSMLKHWIISDSQNNFFENMDAVSIMSAKKLLQDDSILPKKELVGHWNFANMDRVVHRTKDFAFAISMYSKRIQNYEDMNDENKKAWYTSDGMTYLYNNDLNHYSEDFWPTVNPYRMAGTTVDTAERKIVLQKDGIGGQRKSNNSWVGGATLAGIYGACGMALESGFSTLTAKKSWFMFQEEIVALGAGISSSDNRDIETIIENRRLEYKGDNTLIANGETLPCYLGWKKHLKSIKWMHLKGTNKGSDIGYYFPSLIDVEVVREERRGCWKDINADGTSDEFCRKYLTLWINHGLNPNNEHYCYVLLPNKSVEKVESYAEKPDILILENSKVLQAVKNTRLNIIAANLWEDKKIIIENISCNKKACFMVMQSGKEIELAVSDPTMENKGTIEIEIDKMLKEIISKDDEIEVKRNIHNTSFIINVKEAKGKTFRIKFNV